MNEPRGSHAKCTRSSLPALASRELLIKVSITAIVETGARTARRYVASARPLKKHEPSARIR